MGDGELTAQDRKKFGWHDLSPIFRSAIGVLPVMIMLWPPRRGAFLGAVYAACLAYALALGIAETIVQIVNKRRLAAPIYAIFGLFIFPVWMLASGYPHSEKIFQIKYAIGYAAGMCLTGAVGISRSFHMKLIAGCISDVFFALSPFLFMKGENIQMMTTLFPFVIFLMFCQRVKGGIPSE